MSEYSVQGPTAGQIDPADITNQVLDTITSDPEVVSAIHAYDDADQDSLGHHHTLGHGPYQAAPGTHLDDSSHCPVGVVLPFAGPSNAVPSGWLLCDGSTVLTNVYPVLAQVLGTTYGNPGQNFVQLPNLQGRVPIMPDGATFSNTLGTTGGQTAVASGAGAVTEPYITMNYIIRAG